MGSVRVFKREEDRRVIWQARCYFKKEYPNEYLHIKCGNGAMIKFFASYHLTVEFDATQKRGAICFRQKNIST